MGFRELLRDLKNHLGTYQAESEEGENREETPLSPKPPYRPETPETMDGLFCQPVTILVPAGKGPVHSLKQLRTAEVEPEIDEPAPGEEPALADLALEEALGEQAPEEPVLGEEGIDIIGGDHADPDTLLSLAELEEQPLEEQPLQPLEPQPQDLIPQSLLRQPVRPLTRTTVPSTGVAGSWNRNRDRHPWFTGRWWEDR